MTPDRPHHWLLRRRRSLGAELGDFLAQPHFWAACLAVQLFGWFIWFAWIWVLLVFEGYEFAFDWLRVDSWLLADSVSFVRPHTELGWWWVGLIVGLAPVAVGMLGMAAWAVMRVQGLRREVSVRDREWSAAKSAGKFLADGCSLIETSAKLRVARYGAATVEALLALNWPTGDICPVCQSAVRVLGRVQSAVGARWTCCMGCRRLAIIER
jgi:hypothetical protein